jgi:hypothetical protein
VNGKHPMVSLLAVLNPFMAEFDVKVLCFAVYDAFHPEMYVH